MRHRAGHLAFSACALLTSAVLVLLPSPPQVGAATVVQQAGCFSPVTTSWATFDFEVSATASPDPVTAGGTVDLTGTSFVISVSSELIAAGVGAGVVNEGANTVASTVKLGLQGPNTSEATQQTTGTTDLAFEVAIDPVTGAVTINPDPIVGLVPLADTAWTSTSGEIAFAVSGGTPPAGSIPTLLERNAAPIQILNKLNGALNANFYCWPGSANAEGTALVPGSSTTIDQVTVSSGSTSSTSSTSSSSTSSTTTSSTTSTTSSTTSSTSSTTTSSTTTSTTSTTAVPGSNTGTASYTAACSNSITPDVSEMTFELTGTVPQEVIAGETVSLDDHTWTVTVPGSVLDAGIALGLLNPGDTVPATVTPAVFASNTIEGTKVAGPVNVTLGPITASATTGLADPLTKSFSVNDLMWTTTGGTVGYAMDETAMAVSIGVIEVAFACTPNETDLAFVETQVLGSTGEKPAERTPTTNPTTQANPPTQTSPTVLGSTTARSTGETLPRTGLSALGPLLFALALIDFGYLARSATAPARKSNL